MFDIITYAYGFLNTFSNYSKYKYIAYINICMYAYVAIIQNLYKTVYYNRVKVQEDLFFQMHKSCHFIFLMIIHIY